MTTTLAELLATIGPRWQLDIQAHGQQVREAYAPVLRQAPLDGLVIERDVAYGKHPRQCLDVIRAIGVRHAPVVVFVHGGAFVRGDKRTSDEIYDNVGLWFARRGFVAINVEYRLAPEAVYPAGGEDVARALHWVQGHVAAYGGDAERVLLIGHSAGGTHAATCVFDPAVAGKAAPPTALVLISGRLRADRRPENPNAAGVAAYFGADASLDEERSPMHHTATSAVPTFVVIAEFENPLLDIYGLEFAHRLAAARGRAPRFLQVRRHNHMSIVAHFGSGEEALGEAIVEFLDEVVSAAKSGAADHRSPAQG